MTTRLTDEREAEIRERASVDCFPCGGWVRMLREMVIELDATRAELAVQRALWGNIGPETYQTWLRDRDALIAKQVAEIEALLVERDKHRGER